MRKAVTQRKGKKHPYGGDGVSIIPACGNKKRNGTINILSNSYS